MLYKLKKKLKFFELWRDKCNHITEPIIEELKKKIEDLQDDNN